MKLKPKQFIAKLNDIIYAYEQHKVYFLDEEIKILAGKLKNRFLAGYITSLVENCKDDPELYNIIITWDLDFKQEFWRLE